MTWRIGRNSPWLIAALIALAGCATVVEPVKFDPPKSIALVDIPDMRPRALIGIFIVDNGQLQFTEKSDLFFNVAGYTTETPGIGTTPPGLAYLAFNMSGMDTQLKAEGFDAEILKVFPDFDLRATFMKALRDELSARGVPVRVLPEGRARPPRLLWPANDRFGNPYPALGLGSLPAVDEDILMQVCPIAMYVSPGPLNNYNLSVTVRLVLYNGRTKQFLAMQTLKYEMANAPWFARYDSLVAELRQAAPPLRDGLVALAPRVADLGTGRPPRP